MNSPRFSLLMTINLLLACAVISVIGTAHAQGAADACSAVVKDIPIKSIEATASLWANMRKNPGSLNFESNAVFEKARADAQNLAVPANFCPKGCKVPERAVMFFRSTPRKDLTDYSDAAHCKELLKSSTQSPYKYQKPKVHTIDELNAWIGDLSQGKGDSGKDLYKKCDASCSPHFEYVINKTNDEPKEYLVHASITCGEARDKDDDMYKLDAFFRWICEKA